MSWIVTIAILIVLGFVLDREVYFYEGTHLGSRVQSWLYDRWSKKYGEGKRESQLCDNEMLAKPLLAILKNVPKPFILDFATGTGRLSFALVSQPSLTDTLSRLTFRRGCWKKQLRNSTLALRFRNRIALFLRSPRPEALSGAQEALYKLIPSSSIPAASVPRCGL